MADFKLDELTGDLDLTDGLQLTTSLPQEAKQRIDIALGLNLGEFFTHTNYGLPWVENRLEDFATNIRYFLGDNFPDPEFYMKKQLDRYLASLPFIESLDSDFEFDRKSREFRYTYSAILTSGEEVTFPPYLQQL